MTSYIDNRALCAYDIYFSAIESISFLPGLNQISDGTRARLKNDTTFNKYLEMGIFAEINHEVKTTLDESSDLTVTDSFGEKTPVSTVAINSTTGTVPQGRKITIEQCQAQKLPIELSSQIAFKAPPTGWKDAAHVIDALQIQDPSVSEKIKSIFI